MIKIYRVLNINKCANVNVKVGDIVYDCILNDYGLASDDSRITGIKYISVTKNKDGSYPSFTIPLHDLQLTKE